ncbi:MAG: hypothetical protein FIA99_07925 [Ruminiclostridium sp.]|nr:hypothetical protein [Ruminiclostridium sp.]
MSRKMLTRAVALLIAFSMMIALFVGCGNTATNPSTTAAKTEAENTTAKVPEKYVIRMSTTQAGIPNSNEVVDKLSEMLGVTLKMDVLPRGADGANKLNLLLASNDFPDIINEVPEIATAGRLIVKDGFAKFTMDELKANMPKYYEFMNTNAGPAAEKMWAAKTKYDGGDGKTMKALSTIYPDSMIPYGGVWRMDMLEEAGVTSVPTTIEEFGNALGKIKAKWPKNYPMTARGAYLWQAFTTIFGAYGLVAYDWGIYDDGQPMPGMLSKNAKLAFAKLNEWFKKGYIDPEYVTLKDPPNMGTGNTAFSEWAGWANYDSELPNATLRTEAQKLNPNARFAMTPLIKSELYPDVKPTWPVWDPIDYGVGTTGFGLQLENDKNKLYKSMQIVESLLFDKEISLVGQFGIEGKHWTRNGDTVTISEKFPMYSEAATNQGVYGQAYTALNNIAVAQTYLKGDLYYKQKAKYMSTMGIDMQNWSGILKVSLQKGAFKDASGNDINMTEIYKLQDQAFVWLISGEKPISWFDEFVSQWKKAGGDKLIEAANRDWVGK